MIGIDDGFFPPYFKEKKGFAPLVGVLGRKSIVKNISIKMILVDEERPDDILLELISDLLRDFSRKMVSSIATDNIIFAGFSIYDPWSLEDYIKIPLIIVFSHDLDLRRIKSALEKHFRDHERRFNLISKAYKSSSIIRTPRGLLRILCLGSDLEYCMSEVIYNQTSHKIPQPLRSADLIASALGRFLFRGASPEKIDLDHYKS
ncbi:MAG: DUF99 family protein [Sulfolobales archaeon]